MAAVPMSASVSAVPLKTRSRTVRATVPFSPDVKLSSRRKKKKPANKEPNCCNKCGIVVRGATRVLCAACEQSTLDVRHKEAQNNQTFEEEKKKYLDEAKLFAVNLAEKFHDDNAERLFCPVFKPPRGSWDGSDQRVRSLLHLLQEAKKLSKQKCYNWEEGAQKTVVAFSVCFNKGYPMHGDHDVFPAPAAHKIVKRVGKSHAVGMGNGQKHSESFQLFVNEHRPQLRELKLCERATQKVLFYSNNFLHRYLKTEPSKGRRIQRTKGKAVLGKLKSLEELAKEKCCRQRCAGLAQRYATLVSQWRERSQMGQTENRRVLAEMLTPSGPNSTNCYKFISWVTGCSFTTIAKVSKQMLATGGDREPPPHKLKKFWDAKNSSQEESV
ncbi:uncharacterized protein [Dermacentor albipictus]|uniref:uncharacterized protein isoform X2 n=1 Tax=Dermacentor albipictus TaxID=60249 RepID=UPI0038FC3EA9